MTPPTIRPAIVDDAAELARLITPVGHPVTEADVRAKWDAFTAEGNSAFVLEGPGSLLGVITLHRMVVLHRPKPVGRITFLAIDESVRNRGYGRALVEAAEGAFRRVGCGMVEVTSHARRSGAHEFYRRIGYEQTSFRFARVLPDIDY